MRVAGLDVSPNHGAIAVVDYHTGLLVDWWAYSLTQAAVKKGGGRVTRLLRTTKDKEQWGVDRLLGVETWLAVAVPAAEADFYGLEGYSFGSGRGHESGEIGGAGRLALHKASRPFRTIDPSSVKMYVADNANADKPDMREATVRYFPDRTLLADLHPSVAEDLCDAVAVAAVVIDEAKLRAGTLRLTDLREKQRQVFNRVTKGNPINVLGREWLTGPKRHRAPPPPVRR